MPLTAAEYSRPCAWKTSGLAMVTFSESASVALTWGKAISARKGSPSADCTVTRPSASALALEAYSPIDRAAAAARRVVLQRCMDGEAVCVASVG